LRRPAESQSAEKSGYLLSYTGGDDQTVYIAAHPLVRIIDEFTYQRTLAATANASGAAEKPRIEEFISRFENEMMCTELAYKQLKATKKKAY
jgi:hypothetical protein